MKAYDFHPDAESDINAVWDYIAADSPEAADRTVDEIVAAIEALVPFPPPCGPPPPRSYLPFRALEIYYRTELSHCLRPGQKTVMGCRRYAWTPQPPRDGRDPQGQRVTARFKIVLREKRTKGK